MKICMTFCTTMSCIDHIDSVFVVPVSQVACLWTLIMALGGLY